MEHLFIATSGNTCTFMILQEGSNFGAPARWRRAPSEDEQEELDWHVAKVLQRRLAQNGKLVSAMQPFTATDGLSAVEQMTEPRAARLGRPPTNVMPSATATSPTPISCATTARESDRAGWPDTLSLSGESIRRDIVGRSNGS